MRKAEGMLKEGRPETAPDCPARKRIKALILNGTPLTGTDMGGPYCRDAHVRTWVRTRRNNACGMPVLPTASDRHVREKDKSIDIDGADSTTREDVTPLARKAARVVPLERT